MTQGEAVIGEERQVEVTGYSGRTAATVRVVSYDRAQRVRRALKGLATWWGVALVSVLIPVAHFVLVPSFFLYGIYTFARRLGAEEAALSCRGTCPDCGREQAFEVTGRWRLPRVTSCRYCQRSLQLTAATKRATGTGGSVGGASIADR